MRTYLIERRAYIDATEALDIDATNATDAIKKAESLPLSPDTIMQASAGSCRVRARIGPGRAEKVDGQPIDECYSSRLLPSEVWDP